MATFTDLSELDGYEIPASGETIEINIAENYYGKYLLSGSNIVNFNAEDGNQTGEVVIEGSTFGFYNLDGEGESVTITFEVGQNTEPSVAAFSIAFYDTEGEPVGDYLFYQEEGEPPTPPTPTWEDGQHKIYRSGQQVMKMYRSGNLIYLRLNPNNEEPEYDKIPFTFEVLSAGTISWKAGSAATPKAIQYSINDGSWVSITSSTAGTTFNVAAGDKVRFKGTNSTYSTQSGGTYANTFGGTTAQVKVYGNIMSMTNGDNFQSAKTFSGTYVFRNFLNFSAIVDAEHLILPATALTAGCYMGMLTDSSITVAPNLPAAYVHMNCYYNMFLRCTKLTTVQAILPAETVYESSYRAMFYGCTNLTTAPELPAKSLANNCYNQMFDQCSKLNYIKCLATNISATNCTSNWVRGVAASGTFVKDASMTGWTTSTSGIPSGWTVVNA